MPRGAQAADVPAVAHRVQRQQGDERVLGGVQAAARRLLVGVLQSRDGLLQHRLRDRQPKGLVGEGLFGQVEAGRVDDVTVGHVAPLVGDHLLGDLELAEEEGGAGQRTQASLPGDQHVLVGLGLCVVTPVELVDHDRARPEIAAARDVAELDEGLKSNEDDILKLQAKLREARARQGSIVARMESATMRSNTPHPG